MEKCNTVFSDLIQRSFEKINQHPGANKEFYKRFSRSRVLISKWRSGRANPSMADQAEFVSIASQVIKEYSQKQKALAAENEKQLKEFQALLTE